MSNRPATTFSSRPSLIVRESTCAPRETIGPPSRLSYPNGVRPCRPRPRPAGTTPAPPRRCRAGRTAGDPQAGTQQAVGADVPGHGLQQGSADLVVPGGQPAISCAGQGRVRQHRSQRHLLESAWIINDVMEQAGRRTDAAGRRRATAWPQSAAAARNSSSTTVGRPGPGPFPGRAEEVNGPRTPGHHPAVSAAPGGRPQQSLTILVPHVGERAASPDSAVAARDPKAVAAHDRSGRPRRAKEPPCRPCPTRPPGVRVRAAGSRRRLGARC